VNLTEAAGAVQIAVIDDGEGFEVDDLRQRLPVPCDRREWGSTQLGLGVTLPLLEQRGGS
jgi:phosphoglycerate-specific signal transduction histidine kinase